MRQALLSSATDLGAPGIDTTYGSGRVNAVALAEALGIMPAPASSSIQPASGVRNSTVANVILAGSRFRDGAAVALNRSGAAEIRGANVIVLSSSEISCRFDLPAGASTGAWNVVVTNPGGRSAVLAGGFTILSATTPTATQSPSPTETRAVSRVPGGEGVPTDTDNDGKYDDVNGNSGTDFADIVLDFNQMRWIAANEPLSAFDFNANGRIDFADVVWLFNQL
jgi:PKD repeat protein